MLKVAPIYVVDSYSEGEQSDQDVDVLPVDLPVSLAFDAYAMQRPFTEAQSKAYYALMPVTHG